MTRSAPTQTREILRDSFKQAVENKPPKLTASDKPENRSHRVTVRFDKEEMAKLRHLSMASL